jgi:pimeloyl-ACP methyl ester carboxylesterase
MRRLAAAALAFAWGAGACGHRAPPPWSDTSPHREQFVTVAPGIRLETLDWGGSGPMLVFLSGLDDVAHGFDDFAPQFIDHFHVVAITRRGYGASTQTAAGYDLATRIADLTTALDSLNIGKAILAGHSIAGDELTGFAGAHPDRVIALVYFDAAYDHSVLASLIGDVPPQPPAPADSASPKAQQRYLLKTFGMLIPEAQIRATQVFDAGGHLAANVTPDSIDAEVIRGAGHPEYAKVRAPALAFDAVVDSAPQLFPRWAALSDPARAQGRRFTAKITQWGAEQRALFQKGVPSARVVLLHGANHYVFYSNRTDVVREMRAFLAALPAR